MHMTCALELPDPWPDEFESRIHAMHVYINIAMVDARANSNINHDQY